MAITEYTPPLFAVVVEQLEEHHVYVFRDDQQRIAALNLIREIHPGDTIRFRGAEWLRENFREMKPRQKAQVVHFRGLV